MKKWCFFFFFFFFLGVLILESIRVCVLVFFFLVFCAFSSVYVICLNLSIIYMLYV